jgi:putative membrane protein
MWGYMMNNGGYWGGGMFMISHILWWAFIVIGLIALIRWMRPTDSSDTNVKKEDSALRILRERYAHGEISKEEFGERKQNLQA